MLKSRKKEKEKGEKVMTLILMLVALLALIGVAMLYDKLIHISGGQAMLFSVITAVICLYAGGCIRHFEIGAVFFFLPAIIGIIWFVIGACKEKRQAGQQIAAFFSPAVCVIFALFLLQMFLFWGDFIQNLDDLHQWAAEVRYMLFKNHFPRQEDFIGTASLPVTNCLFVLFFQVIAGYHEGNMYAAAFLLVWTGMMLPFAKSSWKEAKKVFAYAVFMYVALYALYLYPYKSLYADLPAAVWAGGLCGFYIMEKKDGQRLGKGAKVTIFAALVYVCVAKYAVGPLMAAFCLVFMIANEIALRGWGRTLKELGRHKKILFACAGGILLIMVGVLTVGSRFLPGSMQSTIEAITLSSEKAQKTLPTLLCNTFLKALNSYSRWKLSFLIVIGIVIAGFVLLVCMTKEKEKVILKTRLFTLLICGVGYLAVLYVTYVSTFSYEESIKTASVNRYFSIYAVFSVMILIATILDSKMHYEKEKKWQGYLALLTILFVTNLNGNFIWRASRFQIEHMVGYQSMQDMKASLKNLEQMIGESDKAYILAQKYTLDKFDQKPLCTAGYYDYDHVSNFIREPWKFDENGAYAFMKTTKESIREFPERLEKGGYTYIWVYTGDAYLKEQFQELFHYTEKLEDHALYQLEYQNGHITGLHFAGKI